MARSTLSLGTEVFLALVTASSSPGLPARSGPPMRAATSMFLISLANDFARRLSMMAFLCLVVAHLEWPDMLLRFSSDHADKKFVHAFLPRHFRVEGGGQQPAGTHCNNSSCPLQIGSVGSVDRVRRLHLGEHFDAVAHPLHPRAADEDCMHGSYAFLRGAEVQSLEVEVRLERLALAAERVAPHGDV